MLMLVFLYLTIFLLSLKTLKSEPSFILTKMNQLTHSKTPIFYFTVFIFHFCFEGLSIREQIFSMCLETSIWLFDYGKSDHDNC